MQTTSRVFTCQERRFPSNMYLCAVICFLVQTLVLTNGYKILAIFPHPSRSHVNVFHPLMEGLAQKGHNVTMISFYKYPLKSPNLKQVQIKDDSSDLLNSVDLNWIKGYRYEKYACFLLLAYMARDTCEKSLSQPVMKQLIESQDSYDLVILEFFNTDCFVPFAYKFNAPLIGLSSCTIMPWTNARFGNPSHPGYIPASNMPFADKMSFFERTENLVLNVMHEALYFVTNYLDDRSVQKHFRDPSIPSVRELVLNASLFLVNTHFSLNLPRPAVPAVIDIGGIHVTKPHKLPKELDKWINESAEGVIYFSLGSMIKSHTFPEEKRRAFLNAFARLPQRVLWKWENETMPDRPDNVRIQKWMPQLDVLCHPNVRAFISHGGLLGTTEAVHCGVPIVVMPQYGDQHTNAKAVETTGAGVVLELWDADEEAVFGALKQVLEPSFRQGAQELSARFRDRPLPPLETAIYWIEYVARHRGAHHMRTAAVDMPFYKYLLLDVILFLLVVSLISVSISCCIMRTAYARIFRKKSQPNTKRKTN